MPGKCDIFVGRNGKRYEEQDLGFDSPCWIWRGCKCHGYGYIGLDGKLKRAHRVYYEYFGGKIPEGKVIDHLCMNKACVNPDHLEPVSPRENRVRAIRAGVGVKVPVEGVWEIRRSVGKQARQMAEKYGISIRQVWMIRTRRSRSEVPDEGNTPGGMLPSPA